ncbi:hypothetical protein F4778DRAFT_797131 [Xylariomycetidae sp. FL2044]|nr:hypothetical protein F4778DRAFT_797131 [Xylariomycetidae sp. FL2044]
MTRLSYSTLALRLAALAAVTRAAHFDVTVGKGSQLKFEPETLAAQPGDTVTYHFFAKNHAVAQSTFDKPCQLQENGVFSGFVPTVSADVEAPTTFTITVNDTKPLWFYCPQQNGNHCQAGMVSAINAPATGNTFDAYKSKAKQAATPSTPSTDALPAGGVRKLHIDVGFDGKLMFNPSNVTELVGTVVEFSYNPANHSIVQSSFDKPCQPLEGGFAGPFVPTQQTPSGTTFVVVITNPNPIWFYCAQTAKTHCQAGMVGSINAAVDGDKTFQAFKDLAAKAPPSTIPSDTPLVGSLLINGTLVTDVEGSVLNASALDMSMYYDIPPPGSSYSPYVDGMAGGSQPADYGWGTEISDAAVVWLQDLQFTINAVTFALLDGYTALTTGKWAGVYPETISHTLGSLAAQSLIHRKTYTDSLQHYSKSTANTCQYKFDADTVDDWLQDILTLLTLHMGATIDIMSLAASSDPWMVPALATALGSEARMTAIINMMQNHIASAAPREALIPYQLVTSYILNHYVVDGSCGGDETKDLGQTFPALEVKDKVTQPDSDRLTSITVGVPGGSAGDHFVAWIGAWGGVQYSAVGADGAVAVPDSLSGHVWAVLTTAKDMKAHDIATKAVAGPEMIWVSQQWVV